jgi:hypothetical protein
MVNSHGFLSSMVGIVGDVLTAKEVVTLRTQYAVEVASLMSTGELRQCYDEVERDGRWFKFDSTGAPIIGDGRERTLGFASRAQKAVGNNRYAMVENGIRTSYDRKGLRINPKRVADEATNTAVLERFNRNLVNAGATELSYLMLKRNNNDDQRFGNVTFATQPLAYAGYAMLFGKDGSSRPAIAGAHATVGNDAVGVTDALRGFVAGVHTGSGNMSRVLNGRREAAVSTWGASTMLGSARVERDPYEFLKRTKLVPTWGGLQRLRRVDHVRTNIVLQVSTGMMTPTLCELATLARKAANCHLLSSSNAVKATLSSLSAAIDRGTRGIDGALPPCAYSLRRIGILEQGHSLLVIPGVTEESVIAPKLPVAASTNRVDTAKFAEVAKSGVTETSMNESGMARNELGFAGAAARTAETLWELGVTTGVVLFHGFVPLYKNYTCPSIDNVVKNSTGGNRLAASNSLALLQQALVNAVDRTREMNRIIAVPGITKDAFMVQATTVMATALENGPTWNTANAVVYVPLLRSHYNALLPPTVTNAAVHAYDS